MLALGSLAVQGGRLNVSGYLVDVKEAGAPAIVGKQYGEVATQDNARLIAHKFADEIILRLGGGVNGIAETKIYFVSSRSGVKEIFAMDYDGQGEHAITHLGDVSLSPHVSPDNSRVAFASLGRSGWTIRMYSLVLGRMVSFPSPGGTTISPAWSADGAHLAFSSDRSGDPEIWISDASGGGAHRVDHVPRTGRLALLESQNQ